jgi:hypothetical protein
MSQEKLEIVRAAVDATTGGLGGREASSPQTRHRIGAAALRD